MLEEFGTKNWRAMLPIYGLIYGVIAFLRTGSFLQFLGGFISFQLISLLLVGVFGGIYYLFMREYIPLDVLLKMEIFFSGVFAILPINLYFSILSMGLFTFFNAYFFYIKTNDVLLSIFSSIFPILLIIFFVLISFNPQLM